MKTSHSDNNDTSTSTDRENAKKPKTRNATTVAKMQTPLKPPFRSAKQMEEKNLEEESNETAATVTPFKHSDTPTGMEDEFLDNETHTDIGDGFLATLEEELNRTETEEIFDYEGGLEEDVNEKNNTEKSNKENEKRNKNKENEEEKEDSDDEDEEEKEDKQNENEDEEKEEEEKEKEQKSKEKEKVTRKENNYENGNGLPKQPILKFNEYKKDDGTVATWETMTEKDWTNWDLDNPPSENHMFWLLDAKIIKHAIQHWIFEDVKIIIPYNWYSETFSCNRKYPPSRPNADQKVIRRGTMLEVYDSIMLSPFARCSILDRYYHRDVERNKQNSKKMMNES